MIFRNVFAIAMVALVACSGCSVLENNNTPEIWNPAVKMPAEKKSWKKNQPEEIKYGDPVRMAIVWSDSVYTDAEAPPTRGFGGRIYFYDANNKPVRADGQLDIYAYNDSDDTKRSQADRRYVYNKEEFQRHHSVTDLGHSYSVWVPWDRVGGERLTVTLLPMFKTADNRLIRGGQDIVVLPGTAREEDELDQLRKGLPMRRTMIKRGYPNRQVNHTAPANHFSEEASIRTTTIKMNRQLGQKLATLPPTVPKVEVTPAQQAVVNQTLPKQNLPPGITPQMLAELQKHNGGNRVTYGGFNRNIGLPNHMKKSPVPGAGTADDSSGDASSGSSPTRTADNQSNRGRVFGMPGAYR